MRQRYYIFIALGLMLLGVALPEGAVAQYYPERKLVRDGNEQFKARNYSNSLKKYQHAYDEDSTKYEVLYNRANSYYQNFKNLPNAEGMTAEEAYARYERIAADSLLSDKQRAEVYRNLGESLFEQEQYEAALNTFRESLRLNPADKATKYNYVLTKRIVDQKRAAQQQQQNQNQDQNKDNQQGGGDQNEDKKDQGQQPKQQPKSGMSEEQQQQLLNAIQAQEDKTQDKLDEKAKGVIIKGKKNW